MSRTISQLSPARRFSFGPLLALAVLLSAGGLAAQPVSPPTATVVMVMPRVSGTAQVVVLQVPSCGTDSPCLLVREVTSPLLGTELAQGSTLSLPQPDPAVPCSLVLVACGMGLLVLRRAILIVDAWCGRWS